MSEEITSTAELKLDDIVSKVLFVLQNYRDLQKYFMDSLSSLNQSQSCIMSKSFLDSKDLDELSKIRSLRKDYLDRIKKDSDEVIGLLYDVIKMEMSAKLDSKVYDELKLVQNDLDKLALLVQKDIMNFVNNGINNMNFNELLSVFIKNNDFASVESLMFVSYFENKEKGTETLESVIKDIKKVISDYFEILAREDSKKRVEHCFSSVVNTKTKIASINKFILKRIIPSVLTLGVGFGIVSYQLNRIKNANTKIFYETSVEQLVRDGDSLKKFLFTEQLEKINEERLCVLERYMEKNLLDNKTRYVIDYSIPYNSKTPLEFYLNEDISMFKPLGNANLVDTSDLNFSSNGEVLVVSRYSQHYDKFYLDVDKKEVAIDSIWFSVCYALIHLCVLLITFLNADFISALKSRNLEKQYLDSYINELDDLLNRIEDICKNIDDVLLKYKSLENLLFISGKQIDLSEEIKKNVEYLEFLTVSRDNAKRLLKRGSYGKNI